MSKMSVKTVSWLLCLALLLQLFAAQPIGVFPQATAAVQNDTIYEENFDSYQQDVALISGSTTEGLYYQSGNGTAKITDGALVIQGNGSYNYIILENGKNLDDYIFEADITYETGKDTWTGTWLGMGVYMSYSSGLWNFFKGSMTAGNGVWINGHVNNAWKYDENGVNKDLNKATPITIGATFRQRMVVSEGNITMLVAVYDAEGKLGSYTEMWSLTAEQVPEACRNGSIGFVGGGNTYTTRIDNIEVSLIPTAEVDVLYEADFDSYEQAVELVKDATTEGWFYKSTTGTATITDGALTINGNNAYNYLWLNTGKSMDDYVFEADITYETGKDTWTGTWLGMGVYMSYSSGLWNFFKGSMTAGNGVWINGHVNNAWKYDENGVNKDLNKATPITIGATFRQRMVVSEGNITMLVAVYDAEGKLGSYTEMWSLTAEQVPEACRNGSIGFVGGSGVYTTKIDNILVYTAASSGEEEDLPLNQLLDAISDIYEPTASTGVVNPPVVGQWVTDALPTLTEEAPAVLMVHIDEELNVLAQDDRTVLSDMRQFLLDYKQTCIPAFIVSSEAEAKALAEFVLENELLDIYILADSGELELSVVEATSAEGADIYTATCDGARFVAAATTAYGTSRDTTTNLRGGLILDDALLSSDLNGDGSVDYKDLAVLCHMAANDTGVTTLIFDGALTVDQMSYFNNHAIAVWGTAMDAADVYTAISAGWFGVAVEQAATAFDVYASVEATTLSGRPMPITHRGAHMGGYDASLHVSKQITEPDGTVWTYYGECENSVAAMLASWNYFGVIASEIDICTTAVCSGDDATCSHTVIEGADACDHANCKLCQRNIILDHDKDLTVTTNFAELAAQYGNIFNRGVNPCDYTLYELKMLTLTGRGQNVVTGEKKLSTFEDVLAATEELNGGNYVYFCHINRYESHAQIEQLLAEHPEYIDNCILFVDSGWMESKFNWSAFKAAMPITFASNDALESAIRQPYLDALEDMITLMNRHNGHFLGYSYRTHTDGNDDFYYQSAARGILAYHSVTNGQAVLAQRHITGEGAVGCLTDQANYVDEWFYYVDAVITGEAVMNKPLKAEVVVRTIEGDRNASANRADVEYGITTISGPEFTKGENGWTAAEAGTAEIVFYYDGTAEGATYRVYSAPVTVTITDSADDESAARVEAVEEAIEAIGEVTLQSKEAIEDARAAYDALSDDEKALVENYATLTDAEAAYKKAVEDAQAAEESAKKIAAVEAAIEAIGEVTLESKEAIEAARTAYDALSDDEKTLVENYATLTDAEAAYKKAVEDAQAAEESAKKIAAVEAAIEAIGEVTLESKEAIEAARTAYDALSDAEKEAVTNYDLLTAAEKAYAEAVAEAEAAAALAEAKDEAAEEIDALMAQLKEEELTGEQEIALNTAYEAALEAIEAAETVDAVEAAVAAGAEAMREAVKEEEPVEPPKPAQNPFKDVKKGDYFYSSVLWAVENKVTAGVTPTQFGPDQNCTRAQVVTFLWRAKGEPEPTTTENPFTDVKEGEYYYKAVLWAVENEITAGLTPTTFGPEVSCTRAQVVSFLYRTEGKPEITETEHPFKDIKKSEYYYDAVLWAVENEVTAGTTATTFAPNETCTRAQIVSFLYRALAE